jgi:hypothetical protein
MLISYHPSLPVGPEVQLSQPGTAAGWLRDPILPRRNVNPRKRKLFSRTRPSITPLGFRPIHLLSLPFTPSPLNTSIHHVQACPRSPHCRGFQGCDGEFLPMPYSRPVPVFCRFTDATNTIQGPNVQSRLAMQQKRNLSIHEYLSARLLKTVCDPNRVPILASVARILFFMARLVR